MSLALATTNTDVLIAVLGGMLGGVTAIAIMWTLARKTKVIR